jgi:hypothetical protein
MMAKSICRGMTAALLSVCAATTVNAADHSLGRGNGSLGSAASIRSYSGAERSSTSVGARHYATFIVINFHRDNRRPAIKSATVLAPKAKIIDVDAVAYENAFAPRNGCVMESGVCVIRGDR